MATLTLPLILLAIIHNGHSLLGYDCGGHSLNITSLSLSDIGNCEIENMEPNSEERYVQLLQLSEYDRTQVKQCKVEIDRTIYYCGMHSHISVVQNGRKTYIQEIGVHNCHKIFNSGMLTIGSAIIDKIKVNTTNSRSITMAGTATMDGRCTGAQYSDGYGTWENVVVQAAIRITLKDFEAPIKRSSNQIMMPTGVHCNVAEGECLDTDGAENFWSIIPMDSCHFDRYDILYEGPANKLSPKPEQTTPIVYTVTTKETTFALTKTAEVNLCGYTLVQTEHPKLFIMETQRGKTFKTRTRISVNNLDIFSYVNSKFIYVEKHIKTQLSHLYKDIMQQKCALEKQILQNALSLSSIAPDEMAYRIMKSPGYTAVTAGEVIHLIKCVPVDCRLRQTEECYNELPVIHRNASLFLLPRSRILTKVGTIRECNELLPTMYQVQGTWYRLTPKLMETLPPPVVKPLTRPSWRYVSPASLATSGIYSTEDLDRLRNHIMFPVEKPSMLNTLARGAMGQSIPQGSISMMNLLDENSLDRIAENAGARLWRGFLTFGSASAGILAIILIARLAKLVVDTIIHGYALHSIYGWSIHLLAALWSSVTHLLLHLGKPSGTPPSRNGAITNSLPTTEDQGPESRSTTEDRRPSHTPLSEAEPLNPSAREPAENHPKVTFAYEKDNKSNEQCVYKDLREYLHKI